MSEHPPHPTVSTGTTPPASPHSTASTPTRSRASTHHGTGTSVKRDPSHPGAWRDSLPDMLKQIEDARSHIQAPSLHHRLSDAGKDAAAVRAMLKPSSPASSKPQSPDVAGKIGLDGGMGVDDVNGSDPDGSSVNGRHGTPGGEAAAPLRPTLSRKQWSPSSWTTHPITQDVHYPSRDALESALSQLELLPPLVTPHEIHSLRTHLASVARGDSFLLQGGDCAELFSYCTPGHIDAKLKLLLQMSLVLIWGLRKPVVRLGRLAGQYAKPRSKPTEVCADGVERHSFRGDIINGYGEDERTPDAGRLVRAYFHSATTLNHVRAQLAAGMADLHRPLDWELGHVRDAGLRAKYERIVHGIADALDFMRTVGAVPAGAGPGASKGVLETVEMYSSHEGLVLEYEQSLTRWMRRPEGDGDVERDGEPVQHHPQTARQDGQQSGGGRLEDDHAWYATSAHFLWIGDRTRQLDGAHVEFFRGIANPIGIKVGPSMDADELVRLLEIVDPWKEAGKVTLISRYGANKVEQYLGGHLEAVKTSGHEVVWMCDPMHGNTRSTPTGIKTRHFSDILSEVSSALRIHKQHGTYLGGVHLELTGEAVTECVGGSEGLVEKDLSLNYTTYCDPRLNEKQALELAFLIANDHRKHHRPHEHGV